MGEPAPRRVGRAAAGAGAPVREGRAPLGTLPFPRLLDGAGAPARQRADGAGAPARQRAGGATGRPRLVVVGQGYVGLPIAVRAAQRGFGVVGLDLDRGRVEALQRGRAETADVGRRELWQVLTRRRYLPTADPAACADFDVAVIAVPTPLLDGAPDLHAVTDSVRTLAPFVRRGSLVVLESTSYPGTTEEVVGPLLEAGAGLSAGTDFSLGFSPERIDPGNRAYPFWRIPKLVSGVDARSLDRVDAFYSQLVESTVRVSSPRVAEMAKLLENTFRYVNIGLVNELTTHAWELGIDMSEVLDAAATKPFGFMRFDPGPGVGGHCLPVDPIYLSWKVERAVGNRFRFVDLADEINRHMPDYLVARAAHHLNRRGLPLNGARILLLGLTYKRNTADDRESPARRLIGLLLAAGADVRAVDEHIAPEHVDARVRLVGLTREELRESDLVVLLVDHDDVPYDLVASAAPAVLDACRRLAGPRVEHL